MSAEVTSRGSNSGTGTTDTIASFTPGANRLLLVIYSTYLDNTVSSISGHGTWSQIAATTPVAGTLLEVWGCITSGSPSASTVVVTKSVSDVSNSICVELSADYSDTTVAASIVQSAVAGEYQGPAVGSYGVTLASFADATNNLTMLCVTHLNSGSSAWTPQGSLTEDIEANEAENDTEVSSVVGEDTTPASANGDTNAFWHRIGLEIAYQGGSVVDNPILVPTGPIR